MLEAAVIPHAVIQRRFPGVAERWMSQVVGQGDGFGQILIEAHLPGDGPADLGDF